MANALIRVSLDNREIEVERGTLVGELAKRLPEAEGAVVGGLTTRL